jgi:predicted alpha/beta-hydrolase family hydrolase
MTRLPQLLLDPMAAGLVLTPGASADRDHSTLLAIEQALPEIPVLRLTLGTTSVPRAVTKIVEATTAFADELGVGVDQLIIGGRSFGGRSCSVAAAEGLGVGALLLLSYPLHPPGKPEKLRVDHFPDITIPTLFISGEKDPFGKPEEFASHVEAIGGPTRLEWVGGAHSPKGSQEEAVVDRVRNALVS